MLSFVVNAARAQTYGDIYEKSDVAFQNKNITNEKSFVMFRSDASPNVGALVIDLFDENMNYFEEMTGGELNVRISNASTNEVVVLLHQPPFTLEWEEIRTRENTYSFSIVSRNHGYHPRPVNSLFFSSNSSWREHGDFAVSKEFTLTIPNVNTINTNSLIMPLYPINSPADPITPEELRKRISEEGFVSGILALHCDIEYFIIGEKHRRNEFFKRSFPVKLKQ